MKVPFEWLNSLVEVRMRPEELADRLTMTGLEIGAIEYHGKGIDGVVVGKVKSVERIPGGDNVLAHIDTGSKLIPVTSDDISLCAGEKVPVALEGAKIQGDMMIKRTQMHGVEAFGYLCRPHELGLKEEQKVLRLPQDASLGKDARKYIGLGGTVLDVDVLPNRGDCQSITGVAREVSAATGAKVIKQKYKVKEAGRGAGEMISVQVKESKLCPRYMARVIDGVEVKDSPEWLRNRLLLAGLRPINNIVDVTNYLLLELGQPMHAFDRDKIKGGRIIVRKASEGEKIVTLDGAERKLEKEMLVISDAERPVALAGVMGGANTEVTSATRTVVLESAFFDMVGISRTSKRTKLRSESSVRFEKGVDWNMVEEALDRGGAMIAELSGGRVLKGKIDIKEKELKKRELELRGERLNKILGIDIPLKNAAGILEKLGFGTARTGKGKIKVAVPSFRRADIEREIDLIEEVARIHGYGNIPTTVPGVRRGEIREDDIAKCSRVREILVGCGLFEAQTFSIVDPGDAGGGAVKITNPMTTEESAMRTSMLPSMLKVVSHNLRHQVDDVRIFEIGKVFLKEGEKLVLSGALCRAGTGYSEVKGIVEVLLDELAGGFEVRPAGKSWLHPNRSASAVLKGKEIGCFGELHPELAKKSEIYRDICVFEFDLKELFSLKGGKRYSRLPKYPKVERDVAMFVPEGVSHAEIVKTIKQEAGGLLEEIVLFDRYKNSQAYRISFRDMNGTLKDETVNGLFSGIIKALEDRHKVQIRK